MTAALWTAVATGLLGSLHCAAMCGPLALAGCGNLPQGAGYFGGRLLSYSLIGAVVGHLGGHALCRLPLGLVGDLALGAVALAAVWRALVLWRRPPEPLIQLGRPKRDRGWAFVASLLPQKGLGLGLVTGVLPCGMLLPAWLLAASTENAPCGAAVMAAFALASAPGLLVPVLGRAAFRVRLPRRLQGAAWLMLAVIVALRPLYAAAHHHH